MADLEAKLDQVQEHGVADSGQLGTMMHQLNITADVTRAESTPVEKWLNNFLWYSMMIDRLLGR